jgi:serine protease
MLGASGSRPSGVPVGGTASAGGLLAYGGGENGVGVTTGPPRVYLVFWGSQWGTASKNSNGYTTFSGDSGGLAPALEGFLSGLGTNGETWSGVMTEYCQGVATNSTSCPPSNTEHVGYPLGGALAGVFEDTSAAAPREATAHQLAAEAVVAATHFGNTTQADNRDTQYFVISPTGTFPDGFDLLPPNQEFCAWHDATADPTLDGGGAVNSPDGILAFTNMPYLLDAGLSCGENFVNSGIAGLDDGVSIVGGHEYAETVTDQFPRGGWTDASGNESGDKCAWVSAGPGASADISLKTGSYAVQSTWANDDNAGAGGCEISHPIVTDGRNLVAVTNPGTQSSHIGVAVNLQIAAIDSSSSVTLTYSATGLPNGLSINSSSGLVTGTPSTPSIESATVTATDSTGAHGSAQFTWTVSSGSCRAVQVVRNGGFETGKAAPWSATSGVVTSNTAAAGAETSHSGHWFAWLDGYGTKHIDTLQQTLALPKGCSVDQLAFWYHIDTSEPESGAVDTLKVEVVTATGALAKTLATYSNRNANTGYARVTLNMGHWAGTTVKIRFVGTDTNPTGSGNFTTNFVLDDAVLNAV